MTQELLFQAEQESGGEDPESFWENDCRGCCCTCSCFDDDDDSPDEESA